MAEEPDTQKVVRRACSGQSSVAERLAPDCIGSPQINLWNACETSNQAPATLMLGVTVHAWRGRRADIARVRRVPVRCVCVFHPFFRARPAGTAKSTALQRRPRSDESTP